MVLRCTVVKSWSPCENGEELSLYAGRSDKDPNVIISDSMVSISGMSVALRLDYSLLVFEKMLLRVQGSCTGKVLVI